MMVSKNRWWISMFLTMFLVASVVSTLVGRTTSKTETFKVRKGGQLIVEVGHVVSSARVGHVAQRRVGGVEAHREVRIVVWELRIARHIKVTVW